MLGFSIRLSSFYAAYFLVVGTVLPFLPVWLEARGLSSREIALIVSVPMVMRVLFTPFIALHAGRFGSLARSIAVLSALAALPMLLLSRVESFAAILLVVAASALFWNPVMPLTEALAMAGVRKGSTAYGRMRLWGSWSFIAANLGGGAVLSWLSPDAAAGLIAGAYAIGAMAALAVRDPPVDAPAPSVPPGLHGAALAERLRSPVAVFIAAAAVAQASHAVFYAFGTVHWQALGIGLGAAGVLWAVGVLAEIVLFAASPRALAAFTPAGLIALGAAGGMLRWGAFALEPDWGGYFVLQVLHAFSFGAVHLGIVHLLGEEAGARPGASLQAIYFTVSGAVLGIAIFMAGPLYAALGGLAYLPMAGLAAAGLLLALGGIALRRISPRDWERAAR
jgi:PPP family 3-phenylpropionic acid transporter